MTTVVHDGMNRFERGEIRRKEADARARAIIALAKKKGLTMEQIGEKFGITRQAVWHAINRYRKRQAHEAAAK